jgi:hypothetical protein
MSRSVGGFSHSGQSLPRTCVKPDLNPTVVGISMKWWSQSLDGKCTCGAPSTAKARFSRSWSSPNATRPRRCGYSGHCFDVRASFPRISSPTNCDPTERRFAKLASRVCMSKDCAPTTARRILISRFDDANERCEASNQPNRLSALFPSTGPFTTRSTCNGI